MENYIALAVPVFLAIIFVEWLADRLQDGGSYSLPDSVSSLSCGVLSQLCSVLSAGVFIGFFGYLYAALRPFAPVALSESSAAAWLLALVGVDFAYYWWHRWSHQVNFLWALHVVHHQSRNYNLTTALRQSSFSVAISWTVYVPLALLGVPLKVTLAMMSFNTLYQFWIHTRLIGRLGFLEIFLNTPSHHRVHHGVNEKYIDKNYAGMLISWDRWFGTFQEEQEEPEYGITSSFDSYDAAWANLHYWKDLAELSRQARGFDKVKVWFMYPGWKPAALKPQPRAASPASGSPTRGRYAAVQLAIGIAALSVLYRSTAPWAERLLWGAAIAAALISAGRLMDRKPLARAIEAARVAGMAGSGLVFSIWAPNPAALWLWLGAAGGAAGWAFSQWTGRARLESAVSSF
jgi:sterol desaturase/sphingolipid hydroxylase (fatty acid hydroxylase superfamily)